MEMPTNPHTNGKIIEISMIYFRMTILYTYIYILPIFQTTPWKPTGTRCFFSRPKQPGAAALGVGADGQQLCQAEEILPPREVASDKKMCKSHDFPKMIYIHAGVLHI